MKPIVLILPIIILWGLWGFFVKLSIERIGLQSIFWVSLMLLLITTGFLFLSQQFFPLKMNTAGISLAVLAGASTALASILFYIFLGKNPVGFLVAITALYPMVTIILSVIFLHEQLTTTKILGFILALSALVLFNL